MSDNELSPSVPDPFLVLNIDGHQTLTLPSLVDCQELVIQEFTAWRWMNDHRKDDNCRPYWDWLRPCLERLDDLQRFAADSQATTLHTVSDSDLMAFATMLQDTFSAGGPCIYSESPQGILIFKMKERFDSRVAIAVAKQLRRPIDNTQHQTISIVVAFAFENGLLAQPYGERFNSLNTIFSEGLVEHQRDSAKYLAAIEDTRRKNADETRSLIAEARDDLQSLQNVYRGIQELKEPANYWQDKRWWHSLRATSYAFLCLLTALVGGYLLLTYFDQVHAVPPADAPALVHVVHSMFPTVVAGLGLFWLLRILVRSYLSQAHLKMDAEERIVMIKTYLAMLERKVDLTADEKKILLTQIFRHAATGVVSDDSAPYSIHSLLTK